MNMGLEELLIDTSAKQGYHRDVKQRGIHIIHKVYQYFFRTAWPQIMNQEKNFFLIHRRELNHSKKIFRN